MNSFKTHKPAKHFPGAASAVLLVILFCWPQSIAAFEDRIMCPICQIEFSALSLPEKNKEKGLPALDGHITGTKPPPLPECPLCGGVFADLQRMNLDRKKLENIVWSKEFQGQRQASTWSRLALLKERIALPPNIVAKAWLQASRATTGPEAQTALEKALEQFKIALLTESGEISSADIFLQMADVNRQLGRFEQAGAKLALISNQDKIRLEPLIRFELKLIASRNLGPQPIPDGNELHQAIRKNLLDKCIELCRNPELLTACDSEGLTPLQLATSLKQLATVQALLKAGANPDEKGKTGTTSAMIAAKTGQAEALLLLLKSGAAINQQNGTGNTLLHLTCTGSEAEREAMVRILIARNIDVGRRNFSDQTALHLAAQFGSRRMLRLLLKAGAKIDARTPDGSTALFSCRNDLIKDLIELGANLETKNNLGQTAFSFALLNCDPLRIKAFKESGKYGTDLNQNEEVRLFWQAIKAGQSSSIERILNKNPQFVSLKEIKLGEGPLHTAILANQMQSAKILIDRGASLRQINDFGRTPLHYAAAKGNLEMVILLTELGADIFALDIRGSTALHEAAAAKARNVYNFLVKLGASDSTRNNSGNSAADLMQR